MTSQTYDKAEVLKLFPGDGKFRKYQKEAIEQAIDAFNSGKIVILLDGPPGSGKSWDLITLLRALGSSFYVTPQLNLIDQLVHDPKAGQYVKEIKGKQNYICGLDNDRTCDIGACENGKFRCENKYNICPYWMAKQKALNAPIVVTSFAYFLVDGRLGDKGFGKREVLTIDEAHNTAEDLIDQTSLKISNQTLTTDIYRKHAEQIRKAETLHEALQTAIDVTESCNMQINWLKRLPLDKTQSAELTKLTNFTTTANTFIDTIEKTRWTTETSTRKWGTRVFYQLTIQPLTARYFSRSLWNRANKLIMSTGTFGEINQFLEETGLDMIAKPDQIEHIKVPCIFPLENRPIVNACCGKMTYTEKKATIPKAIRMIERIIDKEAGKNGAIHCNSYEIANTVMQQINLKYRPLLMLHTSENKKEVLEKWKHSRGKVLLAVALTEGEDWKDDICRYQVLLKVPFPNVQDKRVAVRLNEYHHWGWYYNQTLITIIQAYGRAVRSESDYATFYFVDSSVYDVLKRMNRAIPSWVKMAIPPEKTRFE